MKTLALFFVAVAVAAGAENPFSSGSFEAMIFRWVRGEPAVRYYYEDNRDVRTQWRIECEARDLPIFMLSVAEVNTKTQAIARKPVAIIAAADRGAVVQMLEKVRAWANQARKDRAPGFTKDLGTVSTTKWEMVWDGRFVRLRYSFQDQSAEFLEDDLAFLRVLLAFGDEMIFEAASRVGMTSQGRDYSKMLK